MYRWLNRPKVLRNLNAVFTLTWLTLVIPTLTVWQHSILWVGILSIWANVISHATAWMAGRVEVRTENVEWIQAAQEEQDRVREEQTAALVRRLEVQNLAILLWLRQLASDIGSLDKGKGG